MNLLKYIIVVFVYNLLSIPVYSKVSFYFDSECAHILVENMTEDLKLKRVNNAFGLSINNEYDCWSNSEVRLKNVGKFINGSNVIDLASWLLLEDVENDFYVFRRRIEVYLDSNEYYPCQSIPVCLLHEGQPLLSLGTERGFVMAALSRTNELYLVDCVPDVVVYNYIVYLLLKASKDQGDYLYLRRFANCEEWIEAFSRVGIEINGNLRREVAYLWKFWADNVRLKKEFLGIIKEFVSEIEVNNTDAIPFNYPNGSDFDINLQSFANANYIYDEDLFKWVKWLADNDRIFIYLADISDADQLKGLIDHVYPNKFGLIDFSNTIGVDEKNMKFKSAYLDERAHFNCFNALKSVADDNTMMLWTSWSFAALNPALVYLRQLSLDRGFWVYRALSLNKALEGELADIWRSELTELEGCRVE